MGIINMFTSMDLNTGSCALNSGGSALATDREEMREQIQKNLSFVLAMCGYVRGTLVSNLTLIPGWIIGS